jgi:DNA-binding response OmpR family regulator/GGDEF domain-containing protein
MVDTLDQAMARAMSKGARRTVVFADDSETVRTTAMMALEAEPIDLLLVADGAVVERAVEVRAPDLVVLDVELGDHDGYELCRAVNDLAPRVPVVLLWGESAPLDRRRAREAGATADLRKPFDSGHFIETIGAIIEGRPAPPEPELQPAPQPSSAPAPEPAADRGVALAEGGVVELGDLLDAHREAIAGIIAERFPEALALGAPAGGARVRIVMFEADGALARALARKLGALGWAVEATDDAEAGLARVAEEPPDLILLSVELPGANGFKVCSDLKRSPAHRNIPVIVLSSEATDEAFERHRRLRTRADDYLRKPFEFAELVRRLVRLLPAGAKPETPPPAPAEVSSASAPPGPAGGDGEVEFELEPPVNEQWLVVLWSNDPAVRGRRFNITEPSDLPGDLDGGSWAESLVTVGSSARNRVIIDDPRVSERHFGIQRKGDALFITDLQSESSTWVNDRRVTRAELKGGEVIRAGGTVMKFINDQYLSASFGEIIKELSERDWPSGVFKRQVMIERLEAAAAEGPRAAPLSVLAVFIDDFSQLSSELGALDQAWVVDELVLMLRATFADQPIGRNVEGGYLVLAQGQRGEEAERAAEKIRRAVERRELKGRRRRLALRISVGVVEWRPGLSMRETILRATTLAHRAQQSGGNRVTSDRRDTWGAPDGRAIRTVPDAEWVLRRVLAAENSRPLVGFEIDEERALIRHLGVAGWAGLVDRLIREVMSASRPGDWVGVWKDRYVVAAPDSVRGGERIRDRVLAWWDQFHTYTHSHTLAQPTHGNGDRGVGPTAVRCAILAADDVGEARERALHVLAEALLPADRDGAGEWHGAVPFPLAAVVERARHHRRADELSWAAEVTLRLATAVLAAGLRRSPDAARAAGLDRVLGETAAGPLRLAVDARPLLELAKLARGSEDRFLAPLATLALSRLGRRLVRRVNALCGRDRDLADDELRGLAATVEELAHAVALQLDCRLASVEEIIDLGEGDETVYRLRSLRGPAPVFPVERAALPWRLGRGWCVAIAASPGERPLSLAPLFAVHPCEVCGRLELVVGDALSPTGGGVVLQGLLTGHEARLPAPAPQRAGPA